MIYNGYEVDPAFLEDGNIRWKRANNGEYIFASKTVGGRKTRFFIKRGDTLRYPDKSLPKATFDKYKAKADAAERAVKKIHAAFSGNDWTVTHAAPDIHVFWDADNRFVFVSPLIEGARPRPPKPKTAKLRTNVRFVRPPRKKFCITTLTLRRKSGATTKIITGTPAPRMLC